MQREPVLQAARNGTAESVPSGRSRQHHDAEIDSTDGTPTPVVLRTTMTMAGAPWASTKVVDRKGRAGGPFLTAEPGARQQEDALA